ncbi:MAG: chemotaxis protein CheW [Chloroflexi bacterium]|nr:chemotaxis protein CheW [Chloroflexota bacterium]
MSIESRTDVKSNLKKNGHVQLLTFKLDEQEYALDIGNVVQVVRMVAVTRAPKASKAVAGMINLRGKVIPVVDMRQRCGLPAKPYDLNTQLLIAQSDGHMVALTVDVVSEVLTMPTTNIESVQAVGAAMEFLSAVGKLGDRLILILDPAQVLATSEADDAGTH